MINSVGFLF